jgi:hypothetical protein
MNLRWYISRLESMSFREVLYRIKVAFKGLIEKLFFAGKRFLPNIEENSKKLFDTFDFSLLKVPDKFRIFEFEFDYKLPINWHLDLKSGLEYPRIFSRNIEIKSERYGSAKYIWEVNRMQFLPLLCIEYIKTNDPLYLKLFIKHLSDWESQNPYLIGINWYSNIEVNIRLISWLLCWEILDAEKLMCNEAEFREFVQNDWYPLIKNHCIYSYNNPSKFSSANNHLISEYAGLFIASSKWKFTESKKWLTYAHAGLEKEIIKQHSKNGINKEEAAEYIQFITDFFLLSFVIGEKTDRSFSEQFKQQLYKIFCYIYDFLDSKGNFPKYGDEDDGKCFILDFDHKFNNFKSLLTSGAIIFDDPVLKSKSNGFDIKNYFLFGIQGKIAYELISQTENEETSRFYKDEGHFIFRKKENDQEIYLHFDAAPLGFLSIAAHGHADALSFILSVDGHPVFIDSGTYTYHTELEWRRYFIGTLAHNTIRINQKDQAVNGGPTLWIKHYKTSITDLESGGDIDRIKAKHNGYLSEDAEHFREITLNRKESEFQIHDTIVVRKNRKMLVEIPFHFHPDIEITQNDEGFYLIPANSIRKIEFYIDKKLDPVIIKGQIKPEILGWYSDSFHKKETTSVIYCKIQIECTTTFNFLIKII